MQNINNDATVIEASEADVDLTPMLDVVFIMLIFFLVTSTFVRERGIDVSRSDAPTRTPEHSDVILVSITEDDRIWVEGRDIDPRAVRANIVRLQAEKSDATVVIRAHDHSTTNALVQVMDGTRQAGVYEIALAEWSNQ
ncbi:MAG: biopolymer transporter ExbD [Pseudomonadota bacterium]